MDPKENKIVYDVNGYTDNELLEILDLDNPTDRELEAKILMMIHQYSEPKTFDASLSLFFEQVYERFFDIEQEDEYDDMSSCSEYEGDYENSSMQIEGMQGMKKTPRNKSTSENPDQKNPKNLLSFP
jgi:hypothetical protein